MRPTQILLLFILITSTAWAQQGSDSEIQTLFQERSYDCCYGAFVIGGTQLNGAMALQIGGKGGVLVNNRLEIGAVGEGYIGNSDIGRYRDALFPASDYRLLMGAGGLYLDYIFGREKAVHLSLPLKLMLGGVAVKRWGERQVLDRSSYFALEPGISLSFNMTTAFLPSIDLSYRFVNGSAMEYLSDGDLSGLNLTLTFKFRNRYNRKWHRNSSPISQR